jgi:hypothetical protein
VAADDALRPGLSPGVAGERRRRFLPGCALCGDTECGDESAGGEQRFVPRLVWTRPGCKRRCEFAHSLVAFSVTSALGTYQGSQVSACFFEAAAGLGW